LDEDAAPPTLSVKLTPSMIEPPTFYRPPEDSAWREEVASRVTAHRARRRRGYDPSSSLSLNFDREQNARAWAEPAEVPGPQLVPALEKKVIVFPKPRRVDAGPIAEQISFIEELAEPILEQPRIVEVAEEPALTVEEQPLAGITLDAQPVPLAPELELPLHPAPLRRRVFADLMDTTIVLAADAIFLMIFLGMNSGLAPTRLTALYVSVLPTLFFAAYQYIFLVYGGATPGMTLAGLEVTTFDQQPPTRMRRRCRALAMMLSCISVGLGFAWAALDQDTLCWHDRITRTHLTAS
jgi:uncharacterized RDD family membrane protein YckC